MSSAVIDACVPERRCLSVGRHQHPEDGLCLMEYVSTLAGEAFTDCPRCTDPLLAELARMVNDSIGDDARSTLISLAPRLAALPRSPRSSDPAIVGAALDTALGRCTGRRDLLRHRSRASRRAAAESHSPGLLDHMWLEFYRHGPARHALACAVSVVSEHSGSDAARDEALLEMLRSGIATAEAVADRGRRLLPPAPRRGGSSLPAQRQPVDPPPG